MNASAAHELRRDPERIESENRTRVLDMYQRFDQGCLDTLDATVGADFSARVMGNQTLDWGGFKQFASQFLAAFPDGRHCFEQVIVNGPYVVTVGSYRGTHRGEMSGIPPTNRQVDLAVMHVDRVEDGRIVEHFGIGNALDLMSQLGVEIGGS